MTTAIEQAYSQIKAHNKGWTFPFDSIDPTGADDFFAYLKNNGSYDLVVHRIVGETTVAGTLEVHGVTGTAGGTPTARTPVNKTVNGTPAPRATFSDDPDITGLTSLGMLDTIAKGVAGDDRYRDYPEGIRIKSGQAIALRWDTATGVLTGGIHAFEDTP